MVLWCKCVFYGVIVMVLMYVSLCICVLCGVIVIVLWVSVHHHLF